MEAKSEKKKREEEARREVSSSGDCTVQGWRPGDAY
jgi:hypothetical protein